MSAPLLKGGQGRSASDIERDGVPCALTLLAVLAFVLLCIGRCQS